MKALLLLGLLYVSSKACCLGGWGGGGYGGGGYGGGGDYYAPSTYDDRKKTNTGTNTNVQVRQLNVPGFGGQNGGGYRGGYGGSR